MPKREHLKNQLLLLLLVFCITPLFSQSVVYFNFVSHNEESSEWNNAFYYTANRERLISLANYFQEQKITWNLQSDWVYLSNVLSQETPVLTSTTDNKNILRWLHEEKGVEMDPHAHESQYIYPDVVKLMDSVGLPESKIMGGTIYNDSNGINIWTNLSDGQYGIIFPGFFWQPDYIWGAGTPNHTDDPKYFGVWNPHGTSDFFTHDPEQHLHYLATGCDIKIKDTTSVSSVMEQLHQFMQNVEDGSYPPGFYMQTIFFEQGDLNNDSVYNKVIAVADSINAIIAGGAAEWKTLSAMYTAWETDYASSVFQWECGEEVTAIHQPRSENDFKIWPNPSDGKIYISDNTTGEMYYFSLFSAAGIPVYKTEIHSNEEKLLLPVPAGIYFYRFSNEKTFILGSIVIE